jgi:hypothetical protein
MLGDVAEDRHPTREGGRGGLIPYGAVLAFLHGKIR